MQDMDLEGIALVDLMDANVPPVPDSPAWEAELAHLRAGKGGHTLAPAQSTLGDLIEAATAAG